VEERRDFRASDRVSENIELLRLFRSMDGSAKVAARPRGRWRRPGCGLACRALPVAGGAFSLSSILVISLSGSDMMAEVSARDDLEPIGDQVLRQYVLFT
jgi:hypothetical protein